MMKIENKSGKIIGIDGKAFMPGETGEIPDSYQNNPVISMLANDPDLTVKPVSTDTTSQGTTPQDTASQDATSQETTPQTKAAKSADKADGKS